MDCIFKITSAVKKIGMVVFRRVSCHCLYESLRHYNKYKGGYQSIAPEIYIPGSKKP